MSKFQEGDKVKRVCDHKYYLLFQHNVDAVFTVSDSSDFNGIRLKECIKQTWYNDENFELYREPTQKTFNPEFGDIIITNNGKPFKCMSREEYCKFGGWDESLYKDYKIFGWQIDSISPREFNHMRWRYTDGRSSDVDWDIKEIVPVNTTNFVEVSKETQDLEFRVKVLEKENQYLLSMLRNLGADV